MSFFLGIEVVKTNIGEMLLSQTRYLKDLLKKAGMDEAKPMPTPMTSGLRLSTHGDSAFTNPTLYRSVVGGLQYATITRPDISYAVNKVAQFMHSPLEVHWKAVKRILRYISGSLQFGLKFHSNKELRLLAYCDSDWGSDIDDRKSTSGYCVYLGPNLVSWASKKQHAVSRSSTEAEFRSMAAVVAELTWIQSLLMEMHVPCKLPPTIYCDSQSAVLLAQNPILHSKSKHFELDLFFVRDKIAQKQVFVQHIPAYEQVADLLTKPVSSKFFFKFRNKLRVAEHAPLSLRGDIGRQTVS